MDELPELAPARGIMNQLNIGAANRLVSVGQVLRQVQGRVTRELVAELKGKTGDDAVGEVAGAFPSLARFV
jgi:hypothetical protein